MSTHSGPKVFVVDDEETICKTLAAILRQHGFDAVPYTNPLEALWAVEALRPQLVISDVAMPDINGIELGIRIRAKHASCKILLFSGQAATPDQLSKARMRGHNFDCLSKPMHPGDLLISIKKIVQQSLGWDGIALIEDRPKLSHSTNH